MSLDAAELRRQEQMLLACMENLQAAAAKAEALGMGSGRHGTARNPPIFCELWIRPFPSCLGKSGWRNPWQKKFPIKGPAFVFRRKSWENPPFWKVGMDCFRPYFEKIAWREGG